VNIIISICCLEKSTWPAGSLGGAGAAASAAGVTAAGGGAAPLASAALGDAWMDLNAQESPQALQPLLSRGTPPTGGLHAAAASGGGGE
jgi:hypothetical protein